MNITLVATRQQGEKVFAAATPWGALPFRWTEKLGRVDAIVDIAGRKLKLSISNNSTIP